MAGVLLTTESLVADKPEPPLPLPLAPFTGRHVLKNTASL